MAEVNTKQAAALINTSYMTIHRRANDGTLRVRRVGVHRDLRIDLDDLRAFAQKYDYRFNEELAKRYTEPNTTG